MSHSKFALVVLFTLSLSLCVAVGVAQAHELHHSISQGEAVVVTVEHDEGDPFSNETYELYRPGEDTPFQTGRTDALGRIIFVPNVDGEWRVRAFSEDGHGLDIKVGTTGRGLAGDEHGSSYGGNTRIVLGAAIIIAAFGIISLFYSRRRATR
jgi:nickel transport protein